MDAAWLAIKRTYMLLEEWFADRRLYHLVGFLIWCGEDVNALRALAGGVGKREFKKKLKAKIFASAFGTIEPVPLTAEWIADQLDGLDYNSDSRKIRRVLLLFNLATLIGNEQSNMRFQFESFKTASWDIEHVRSVTPDRPGTPRGKVAWLEQCRGYLKSANESADLQVDIQAYLDLPPREKTDMAFDGVYEKLLRHFREDREGETDNGISNLVLLDSATNRSYQNAVFAVKRHRVLSLDRDGVFVPLCTRNVFLKCYNPKVEHLMFWTQEDADGYRQVMVDTLHAFFMAGFSHE